MWLGVVGKRKVHIETVDADLPFGGPRFFVGYRQPVLQVPVGRSADLFGRPAGLRSDNVRRRGSLWLSYGAACNFCP